jgi:hypothetical protein
VAARAEAVEPHESLWIDKDVSSDYTAEQWARAHFLLGELVDLSGNFHNDALVFALLDARGRVGIAHGRAKARDNAE